MLDSETWKAIFGAILDVFSISKLAKCTNQDSSSGHDFQKTVLGTGTSVIIVFACTYCGKTFKEETKVDSGPSFSVDTLKGFGQPS